MNPPLLTGILFVIVVVIVVVLVTVTLVMVVEVEMRVVVDVSVNSVILNLSRLFNAYNEAALGLPKV